MHKLDRAVGAIPREGMRQPRVCEHQHARLGLEVNHLAGDGGLRRVPLGKVAHNLAGAGIVDNNAGAIFRSFQKVEPDNQRPIAMHMLLHG